MRGEAARNLSRASSDPLENSDHILDLLLKYLQEPPTTFYIRPDPVWTFEIFNNAHEIQIFSHPVFP
jgi:hypothetical protein